MKNILIPFILLSVLIICSCGDSTDNPTVEITVNLNDFTASIDENPEQGASIGTLSGSTNEGSVSYSLSNQNPGGALAINSSSGEITVADPAAFDFETNPSITATATASNSGKTKDASVTVNVNDVDEGGSFTVWTGANVTFTKDAGADPELEANQDRITDNVWITRANTGGQIYNIKTETGENKDTSPAGTRWAIGNISDVESLEFKPFRETVGKPKEIIGIDLVMHLVEDNIYLAVKITSWDTKKTGGFAYERTSE